GIETRRSALFPASVTNPGGLAENLDVSLDDPPTHPTALLVSDAQWADGTSLATLQGVIAGPNGGVLLVGTHTELTGYGELAFRQLTDTAVSLGSFEQHRLELLTVDEVVPVAPNGELARVLIDRSGGLSQDLIDLVDQWIAKGTLAWEGEKLVASGPPPEAVGVWDRVAELDRPARKLVEAVSLAAKPVSLPLAASLLSMPSDDVLELGESLAGEGLIRESMEGFVPVNAAAAERIADRLGEVRRARAFGELAEAKAALGLDEREPAVVGSYYLAAARWDEALRLLSLAGLAATDRQAFGEALPMVQGALQACEASGSDDAQLEGRLRLARAQCYQAAVWLDLALDDADRAASLLSGSRKVDALGYAASVALDLQRSQVAESYAAAGLHEALAIDEPAKHGSLLTLHARIINRIGFGVEADAEYEKGIEIVRSLGTPMQLHWAHVNGAWIAFDRGQAREAEVRFAEVTDEAERLGGISWRSDREAQWSRALFLRGRIAEGETARRRAMKDADISGLPITHIPHMSFAEGMLQIHRYEDALRAADDMLAVAIQKRLGWENAARYLRAKALRGLGRLAEAAEEVQNANDATPLGIDGWRWRLKIRVLQMALDGARNVPWPEDEALTLTDELLHNKWYLTAAELLIARASYEKDPGSAEEAAALAVQLGVPALGAEALQAGDLWKKPAGAAVIAAVKEMAEHIPDEWREEWSALPAIVPALAAPDVADEAYEAAVAELESKLEQSLAAAGFGSTETLLSPAQRRAGGLRKRPRRRPLWQLLAAGLGGAAILAVGGILAVNLFGSEQLTTATTVPTTAAPSTTTTVPLEAWETDLGIPAKTDLVAAQWSFRADIGAEEAAGLPGVSTRPVLPSADGYYWNFQAADRVRSSPAVFGETVVFGSDDGNLYGLVVTSGPPALWSVPTDGAVVGAPMVAEVTAPGAAPGATDTEMRVFFGSLDGRFRSRDVFQAVATPQVFPVLGTTPLDPIEAAPLIMDDRAFFGTEAGEVWALDAATFEPLWEVPFAAGSKVTVAPVGLDGFVYVGTEAGVLWKIDAESGIGEVCYPGGGLPITSEPVIADGIIYIPVRDGLTIEARRAGSCSPAPSISLSAPVESSPAVAGGVLYTGNGRYLEAWDLNTSQRLWAFPGADVLGGLSGVVRWPVVVNGGVYFTSDDGWLWAVDKDGQELWRYYLGAQSVTSPAPGTAIVLAADVSGTLHAIGCSDPPDCEPSG
ncbi:MAG: outer membrane protein assembly factor BamB family protein, partial [Acidimicrobiia bacterium]